MRSRTIASMLAFLAIALAAPLAAVAATFNHQQIAYYVPDKRIRVDAAISDPKGVQVARVYFKAGAQADYIFVPMQQSAGRYVATLPAPSASANSMEYLLLAMNGDGQVSRTDAYKVAARRSNETPSWQSASGQGDVKVFTEIPNAPKPVAMYSDSIAMDVVESGARLGAAAGLYPGGGGAGGATATASTAGGVSTAVIVGGLAVAGIAVAAGSRGGGDSGGTPSTNFAGTYNGSQSGNININCGAAGSATCTVSAPVTINVNSSNTATGVAGNGTVNCNIPGFGTAAQAVASGVTIQGPVGSNGVISIPGSTISQSGVNVTCQAGSVTLNATSHTFSGSQACSGNFNQPPNSCTFNFTLNYQ